MQKIRSIDKSLSLDQMLYMQTHHKATSPSPVPQFSTCQFNITSTI